MPDFEKEDDRANPYNERQEIPRKLAQSVSARVSEERALADPDSFDNWIKANPPPDMNRPDYPAALEEWDSRRVARLQRWWEPFKTFSAPRPFWERERANPKT